MMSLNRLYPMKKLTGRVIARYLYKQFKQANSICPLPMRYCSTKNDSRPLAVVEEGNTPKEQIPMNVVEENHSWSYEFDETEIKGIGFAVGSGNYVIIYTCKVCETRQSRSFTKNAYHKGVVIVRCEGCENLHLIADNLKWFEEDAVNVEDLVKRENKEVVKVEAKGELKEYFFNKIKKKETQPSE